MSILPKTDNENDELVIKADSFNIQNINIEDLLTSIQPVDTLNITSPLNSNYIQGGYQFDTSQLTTISGTSIHNFTSIKWIVAGSREEYDAYVEKKNFSKSEYQYLYDADMIRGMRNVHGFYVGSWRERDDIVEIKQNIIKCNMGY